MINKVLCVDDDQVTLILCKILLDKTLFCKEMDEANDGFAALKYFEQLLNKPQAVIPDLIFLDINMPGLNGWGFLDDYHHKYYSLFPACKIIILVSNVNNYDGEKAKKYPNVIGFLQKPLSIDNLEKLKSNGELMGFFGHVPSI